MSEMMERVAIAIFTAHNGAREHAKGLTWEKNAAEWEKAEYRKMARAAVAAMREPTQSMFLAGREIAHSGDEDALMNRDSVKGRWWAMIDAELKAYDNS